MREKIDKNSLYKELSVPDPETKDLPLLDQIDKQVMIIYLFIFILGIILTALSI